MFRQYFLLFHRYAGFFMAFFLIIVGVTGSIIAFYDELDAWLNPNLYFVQNTSEHLPLDTMVQHVEQSVLQGRGTIRYIQFPRNAQDSMRFIVLSGDGFSEEDKPPLDFNWVFADPYTGNVLGTRKFGAFRWDRIHILPWLYELHYSLTVPWPYGSKLLGIVALMWVFDCFIAFYLTLPRRRQGLLAKWPNAWKIKWRAAKASVIRDLHIAVSLWLWAMLLMFAVSGVMFNLNQEVYQPLISRLVQYESVRDTVVEASVEAREYKISWQQARNKGLKYLEYWQNEEDFEVFSEASLAMDFGKYAYRFQVKSSLDLPNGYAQTRIYLSASDGQFLARAHPEMDAGNYLSSWLAALHMGRVFGAWYQTVVALMGIIICLLTVTGVLIWWRKRRGVKVKSVVKQR